MFQLIKKSFKQLYSVTRSDHPLATVNADCPAVSRCDTHRSLINHFAACCRYSGRLVELYSEIIHNSTATTGVTRNISLQTKVTMYRLSQNRLARRAASRASTKEVLLPDD